MNKIPSIKEIRKLSLKDQSLDAWSTRVFYRKTGTYLTWLLLHTSISPSQTTFVSLITGLIAVYFFTFGRYEMGILAALLYELYYLFDVSDGDIARFKKIGSPKGHYFDRLVHAVLEPLIFIGISIGAYKQLNNILFLYLGYLISFSLMIFRIFIAEKYRIFVQYKLYLVKKNKESNKNINKPKSLLQKLKEMHDSIGFIFRTPALFNIILIAAIFGKLHYLLYFYGLFLPLLSIGNFYYESIIRFDNIEQI
jgi:phosphatidylglycerophosphate synthase